MRQVAPPAGGGVRRDLVSCAKSHDTGARARSLRCCLFIFWNILGALIGFAVGAAIGVPILAIVLAFVGVRVAVRIQVAIMAARIARLGKRYPTSGPSQWQRSSSRHVPRGPSEEHRFLYLSVASFLNQILLAHSADSAERRHAEQLLSQLSDGELSRSEAGIYLDRASAEFVFPPELMAGVSRELRLTFLRLAIDVALVDGHVTDQEQYLLKGLAHRLQIPSDVVDHLLEMLTGGATSKARSEVQKACEVLGVSPDDDISVIRAAHRKLIRKNHPDLFPEHERAEATKRASEINAAYDLLIGAT